MSTIIEVSLPALSAPSLSSLLVTHLRRGFAGGHRSVVANNARVVLLGDMNTYAGDDKVLAALTYPGKYNPRCPESGK